MNPSPRIGRVTTHNDALRYDVGQITTIERTPQGFLKIPGFATRVGVFVYRDAQGGIRRELRHPDDVFAPESLATLRNVPVTLEHPPVMVTPDNFREFSRGYTTDRVEVNRDLVETDVIVADDAAIESVETKERRELSCGYLADLVPEQGDFNGAPYDCRQKNIRYNHLAIVKSGRGGPEIRLRMDSMDAVMIGTKRIVVMGQEIEMPADAAAAVEKLLESYDEMKGKVYQLEAEVMKDRKDVDINQKGVSNKVPEVQGAPDGRAAGAKKDEEMSPGVKAAKGLDAEEEEKKKKDAEEKEKKDAEEEQRKKDAEEAAKKGDAEELKKQLDAMTAKCDALEAKVDEYEAKKDTQISPKVSDKPSGAPLYDRKDSKDFQAAVRARVKLERDAARAVGSATVAKFDSMSDDELRAAVIKARYPKAELAGKSSAYLESRFDSIVEQFAESESVRRSMGGSLLERTDAMDVVDPAAARQKAHNDSKDAWKADLSASKKH